MRICTSQVIGKRETPTLSLHEADQVYVGYWYRVYTTCKLIKYFNGTWVIQAKPASCAESQLHCLTSMTWLIGNMDKESMDNWEWSTQYISILLAHLSTDTSFISHSLCIQSWKQNVHLSQRKWEDSPFFFMPLYNFAYKYLFFCLWTCKLNIWFRENPHVL